MTNDLGSQVSYRDALVRQERLVDQRVEDQVPDTLLLLEHCPVFTLGRNADPAHVLWRPEELRQRGVEVVATGRGGDVTYHGPGQLTGYPILKLAGAGRKVVEYIERLEEVLIRVLRDFGIDGGRDEVNHGVWCGSRKIAALGIRVTRGVTMHGFALNVCPDLCYYTGIIPCGLMTRGVVGMNVFCPGVTVDQVKPRVIAHFADVFNYGDLRHG